MAKSIGVVHDIAKALGRSQMWARRACDAALRRENSANNGRLNFNLSINGFRKFTSSELLDIPRLRDQLDHHWAEAVAACVQVDDPPAYGVDKLRHARRTVVADLRGLDAATPINLAKAREEVAPSYYTTLSSYQDCGSFTQADFDAVTAQLAREWTAVPIVWRVISSLQAPLLGSQGNAAEIASIADAVDNDLSASSDQGPVDMLSLTSDLLWAVSGVPGVDVIGGPLNVLAGALSVADQVTNLDSGVNDLDTQITTTGADLGASLEQQYTTSIDGLGNIGDILVSDWTKLQDVADNATPTADAAADWNWTATQATEATDQLLVAARRTAYETLFPLSYSLWQLFPASSLQDVNSWNCAELVTGGGISAIETWTPFSSVQPLGTFAGPAGTLDLPEQWMFADSDQTVLTDWGSPPARVPGNDLLEAMFGPAPDDIQTGPLFTNPLQFAVEAYNDGTTNTINLGHVTEHDNGNFCQAITAGN